MSDKPIRATNAMGWMSQPLILDPASIHPIEKCAGQYCCIHNPSQHSMVSFPQLWRADRYLMERTCPHGIGHPDPDDIDFKRRVRGEEYAYYEGIHGCDGCCQPLEVPQHEKAYEGEGWYAVRHKPVWQPTQLRYNAAGDTKPGFHCVHELENGNGICDANVFKLEDEIGDHTCIVVTEP